MTFTDQNHKREWIEERSAILEFDAGMERSAAEALAREMAYDLEHPQKELF